MGPCTASHCCCLPSPHSAMCHFQVSSPTAGGFHFCHRVLYGLPLLLGLQPATTLWLPTLWFWPVTWPNGVKCAVILRSSTAYNSSAFHTA
ncbi:unnamed protein product [Staurois parvus]|uniref:Uncharacterized protein n=1 Tax=Staurois parvus TaxID=386267 RepID=A0ABN9BCJ1_9NEOB|nr:unnamed protein product [Staurois parvus]